MDEARIDPQAQVFEMPANIDEKDQETLVKKLKDHYDSFKSDVSQLHSKLDHWHRLYEGQRKESKTFPWKGASNYVIPLIMASVDSYHARLVKAVFDQDPLWMTRPRTPEGVNSAVKAQWYLDYWADQMDTPEKLDMVIHSMLIEGVGVAKLDWVRSTRKVPETFAPAEFGVGPQEVVEYEGPELVHVPLKDFVLVPADSPTIDDAVYVGHRVWRTRQQLERSRDAGYYFNVNRLFTTSKGADNVAERTAHPSNLVAPSDNQEKHDETNLYEIVELYGPYDFGDGPVSAVMAFSPQHDILLRVEPSPYQYGRAPYVNFCAFPRPNFFFGRSLAEILESPQEELTALHNMRADAVTRVVAPPILKKFGSRWDEEKDPLRPYSVIPVNSMDEIAELGLRDIPQGIFAHEQEILSFVERSTGMSDYFMGRSAGPYHTATEVNKVTSEGLARVDVAISRFQRGMKRLGWLVWWLLYQYRPYWDYFYAENQQMSITKVEMRPAPNGMMPFEIVPQGMLSESSKAAQRQQNLMLLQTLAPTLQQFYPDGLQVLLDKILIAFDVQDRSRILGPNWQVIQQQIQQAMQQGYQQGMEDALKQAKTQE